MSRATIVLALALGLSATATGALAQPASAEIDRILDADRAATARPAAPAVARIELDFDGMGLKGKAESLYDLQDGRFVDSLAAGPAIQVQGFDGAHAWQKEPSGAVTIQDGGEQRALAVNDAYRRANLWWRPDRGGAAIQSLGVRRDAAGGAYDVLTVTPTGGKAFEVWFDTASHRLARVSETQGAVTVLTSYDDYRPASGAMIPWRTIIDDGHGPQYRQTLTVVSARIEAPPAAGAFAAPTVKLADFSIDGGKGRTVIPFHLINNHVYAEAKVNGKGPFLFIFDTGGLNLVTPALAKTLGLNVEGRFDGQGAGEGTMEAGFSKVGELAVGEARMKDQVFTVASLDSLSDVEGVDEQGMVGFETFRRFVTRIDYGAGAITLIDPKTFDPADAGVPIHFDFADNDLAIEGAFEGLPGKFRVDTGSRVELTLNRPFADRNGVRATHPRGVEAVDGWGFGGATRSYVTRGASVKLGSVEVKGVVTSLSTQTKGALAGDDFQGNVGGGLLKRFVVTFDYGHQTMYLKPIAAPVTDTGTFDRAGMWMNRAAGGFKVVDVTAGGPVEAAGVKVGDTIIAVDGESARSLAVHEFRQRLRTAAPGTVVTLTIRRDGRSLQVSVTLRDLI